MGDEKSDEQWGVLRLPLSLQLPKVRTIYYYNFFNLLSCHWRCEKLL
jgi:hypothetical protein